MQSKFNSFGKVDRGGHKIWVKQIQDGNIYFKILKIMAII